MTYPIITTVDPDLPRTPRRHRRASGRQLSDLSAHLLADIGVVRQRTGRYAASLLPGGVRGQTPAVLAAPEKTTPEQLSAD